MQLGTAGPLGRFAFTEKPGGRTISGVLAIAGIAATSFVLHSFNASVLNSAGAGATSFTLNGFVSGKLTAAGAGAFAPVLHSFDGAVFSSVGLGGANFPGSRIDNRVFTASGTSTCSFPIYPFYLDAERADVQQELRAYKVTVELRTAIIPFDPTRHVPDIVWSAPPENRIAIIPFENRVYQVGFEYRRSPTPNRKRV